MSNSNEPMAAPAEMTSMAMSSICVQHPAAHPDPPRNRPLMPRLLSLLAPGSCLGLSAALACGAALGTPPARAQDATLYRLETTCSLAGAAPQPCVVEAIEDDDFITYRHTIGDRTETIRISDAPVRMGRLETSTGSWEFLSSAGARFSTNTICFNGTDVCVINPNYLNSIREERPESTNGRDLVRVLFGDDGRVHLTCYDDGCEEVQ